MKIRLLGLSFLSVGDSSGLPPMQRRSHLTDHSRNSEQIPSACVLSSSASNSSAHALLRQMHLQILNHMWSSFLVFWTPSCWFDNCPDEHDAGHPTG